MSQDIVDLFTKTELLTADFVTGKLAAPPAAAADPVPSPSVSGQQPPWQQDQGQQGGQSRMSAEAQQAAMQARMVAEAQQRHLAQLGLPQAQLSQGQGQGGQGNGVPLLAEPVAQPGQQVGGAVGSYQQPIQDGDSGDGNPGGGGGGGGGRRQVRMSFRMSGVSVREDSRLMPSKCRPKETKEAKI